MFWCTRNVKITTLNLEKLELRRNVVEYEVRWVYFKDF